MSPLVMETASTTEVGGIPQELNPTNGCTADPSHEEHQYLNLIREILAYGEHRPDRFAALMTILQTATVDT